MPHLDILNGHGGILHADYPGILHHLLQQGHCQRHARQLGNVVDHEVRVGGGIGDVIPVLGNGGRGQLEVDGGDGRNGVHAQALGVSGQLTAVGGVVAGHVGDDGHLAAHLGHHILQCYLPLGHALIDALAGGAAHI